MSRRKIDKGIASRHKHLFQSRITKIKANNPNLSQGCFRNAASSYTKSDEEVGINCIVSLIYYWLINESVRFFICEPDI